jgi:DNA-binding GntR family transcriptional regulator
VREDLSGRLKKIEREPLWDLAQNQLRDALFGGRFDPGSHLTLRHLAEMFGTSITPVRDAVTRLIAQGILEQGARSTAVVPDIKAESLRQLTLLRVELEGLAAREAAARSSASGLRKLEDHLERMRMLIERGEFEAYLDVHRRFHFGIYEMAGIPLLQELISNLWLRCGPILSFVVPQYVRSLKGTDHHAAVLLALQQKDGAQAEAEIVADINEAASYLLSLADSTGRIRRMGDNEDRARGTAVTEA